MKTANWTLLMATALLLLLATTVSCDRGSAPDTPTAAPDVTTAKPALTSAEMENLVRRSYQYVALFNTLNDFAVNAKNPFASGGWNKDPLSRRPHGRLGPRHSRDRTTTRSTSSR